MNLKTWRPAGVLACGALVGALFSALPATTGHADGPACPVLNGVQLTQSQSLMPPGGNPAVVCTGKVPSFDGTPLHVDVTLPTAAYQPAGAAKPRRSPLVMFLSGWSNDVCQFESTTFSGTAVAGCTDYIGNAGYDWNNAWFASQGFVTVNYTPRGWNDSCGKQSPTYSYQTDPACSGGSFTDPDCPSSTAQQSWVHLYDRRWEIRDAQFLAGLVVDSGFQDPASGLGVNSRQVITTGDSGGGGPSWDLALSHDRVVESCSTPTSLITEPWASPQGARLRLAAAIPLYTWTDLVDALVSNGGAADHLFGAPHDRNRLTPVGVEKESYVDGLYALGQKGAQYAPSGSDPDINKWYADITAGEPYTSGDIATIESQVGGALRSPFRIPIPQRDVKPIFSIQGLTDPLFNGLQTETMVRRLLGAVPGYPVWGFYGDVGHSYAQNPLAVWQQAHDASNAWLQAVLSGTTPSQPRVTVSQTLCDESQPRQTFTAGSFGDIAGTTLSFNDAAAQTTTSSALVTSEGKESDPIVNSTFCDQAENTDADQATYTFAVPAAATMVGGPVVHVTAAVTFGGTTAELAARLWDVTPATGGGSATQSLIARTVYRLEADASGAQTLHLVFELPPNAWQLVCGHQLKLELTQDDAPTWRPDNDPSTMSLSNLSLSLPVVPGPTC